jgi:SRSO17 transposase
VEIQALEAVRLELDLFTQDFEECIKTRPSRKHFARYLAGQLSGLQRKNAESIAELAGIPPRTMQQFLATYCWDEQAMIDCLQKRIAERHGHSEAIGLIDETSFPKKGMRTPGVKRQHCGATGKTDNCAVTVHLGYVADDFHALLDGDIYLPEDWLEDEGRCEEAGVPDALPFRTKPEIALQQLEAASERGVAMRWLCADEAYGRAHTFRLGVQDLGITYAVEIPCNLMGWLASRGTDSEPRRVDRLWKRGGPSWETWHVKNLQKGPSVWEARAARFHPREEKVAGDEQWLIIARNVMKPKQVKYFLCNAEEGTELGEMLRVAFLRWHIERLFREGKNETGMDHFEGRIYQGWKRHLVLTSLSLLFLSEQRQRLQEAGEPFSVEQVRDVVEVQLDPEMPRTEVRRQLGKVLTRIQYHQRRNATARRSHTKTSLERLAEAGVDLSAVRKCPGVM